MIRTYRRKLVKTALSSTVVNLPKEIMDQFNWRKGDEVALLVDLEKETITIQLDDPSYWETTKINEAIMKEKGS